MMSLRDNYLFDIPRRLRKKLSSFVEVVFKKRLKTFKATVICPERLEAEELTLRKPEKKK